MDKSARFYSGLTAGFNRKEIDLSGSCGEFRTGYALGQTRINIFENAFEQGKKEAEEHKIKNLPLPESYFYGADNKPEYQDAINKLSGIEYTAGFRRGYAFGREIEY